MREPDECRDMQDIRAAIDGIDREVIALLGRRYAYVQAATKFKASASAVSAPERFRAMLAQRRAWAQTAGLDPNVIEQVYRDLVNYFIAEEMKQWESEEHGQRQN